MPPPPPTMLRALPLLCAAPAGAWMLAGQQSLPLAQQLALERHQPLLMLSRRKVEVDKLVDEMKMYEPAEAVALLKKAATAKFSETAELHGNLNLDPKYNDQQIRTTVSLPHGTGKSVRVAVSVPFLEKSYFSWKSYLRTPRAVCLARLSFAGEAKRRTSFHLLFYI